MSSVAILKDSLRRMNSSDARRLFVDPMVSGSNQPLA